MTLDGPFIYFLSTINVDRLEPQFQITPLINAQPPTGASCDVVIIRPLRDPSISHDNHEARELFAAKMWTVLGGAYEEGRHVNFRYNSNGEIGVDGDGPTVVEYIRCGGWEWIPVSRRWTIRSSPYTCFSRNPAGSLMQTSCAQMVPFPALKGVVERFVQWSVRLGELYILSMLDTWKHVSFPFRFILIQ